MSARRSGLLAAIALSASSGSALAQSVFDHSANVTVQDRPRPGYEQVGERLGGFMLYPSVTVSAAYDDNILETPASTDDAVFTFAPSATLKSNWSRNSLSFTADAALDRAASHGDVAFSSPTPVRTRLANSDQYHFIAAGRIDVRHDLKIDLDASYGRELLPRTFDGYLTAELTPGLVAVAVSFAPLYTDTASADVKVTKDFARFRVTATGRFQDLRYTPGFGPIFAFEGSLPSLPSLPSTLVFAPIDQAYHDHRDLIGRLRLDYPFTPDLAVFVEEAPSGSRYPNARNRDRFDNELLAGVSFQVRGLVTAELAVGDLYSQVSGPGLEGTHTPDFRAKMVLFPTQLTDVTFTARQFIDDSGVPQSPNYIDRQLGLALNYELLRNLLLGAQVTLDFLDYRDIDRRKRILDASFGATYLVSRATQFTLSFDHRQASSTGADSLASQLKDFDQSRLSLSVVLRR